MPSALSGVISIGPLHLGIIQSISIATTALMLIGLTWLIVFQLAGSGPDVPSFLQWMADLNVWNYAIAFAFMITGLLLTMRWR